MAHLSADLAQSYARVALANVKLEYPNHLSHLLHGPRDARTPRELHPAFYGSYDWHSAVHMHWLLVRLLRLFDSLPSAPAIRAVLDEHLDPDLLTVELAYFQAPGRASYERPYGWAWLVKLAAEVDLCADRLPESHRWKDALAPLASDLAGRFALHLRRTPHPVRAGTHGNTAFAMLLALDWTACAGDRTLRCAIVERAQDWFARDTDYPARYEPSGADFLSGGLIEAVLMQRVLTAPEFTRWWRAFSPKHGNLETWMEPASATDRADPKTAHLDGLNLSRAWCLRVLGASIEAERALFEAAAQRHLKASLSQAVHGDYVGTHWLASFATLALTG